MIKQQKSLVCKQQAQIQKSQKKVKQLQLKTLQIQQIHKKYFEEIVFTEIDHAPTEQFTEYFQVQQECLLINFAAFDQYYPTLMKIMTKQQSNTNNQKNIMMACDIILAMNGQNDKAWNIKKFFLIQGKLDISKELKFNRAVCLKCKKSSSYYEYRLRLLQKMLQKSKQVSQQKNGEVNNSFQICLKILDEQNILINQVLARFFRNYFCWMYRIKLIKLLIKYIERKCEHKEQSLKKIKILIEEQNVLIHKFLQKNCNDYSGYSYLTSLVTRHNLNLNKQLEWAAQMFQFCKVAYFEQSSYNRLSQFIKFIQNKSKK